MIYSHTPHEVYLMERLRERMAAYEYQVATCDTWSTTVDNAMKHWHRICTYLESRGVLEPTVERNVPRGQQFTRAYHIARTHRADFLARVM